jgi:hypothetical protein
MRYVVRLITMTTILMLVFYGLDYLFPAADRFPGGLSLFATSFMLASVPGPGDLAAMTPAMAMRLVPPAIGIALALWIVVGVSDLHGPSHSDSVLTVGGLCLALELIDRGRKWRRHRRDAAGPGTDDRARP